MYIYIYISIERERERERDREREREREIARSNLIDQKRRKELSCDLIESGTLFNIKRNGIA